MCGQFGARSLFGKLFSQHIPDFLSGTDNIVGDKKSFDVVQSSR